MMFAEINVKKTMIAAVIVTAILLVIIAMNNSANNASSATPAEWTGFAGKANHVCYHHKGVLQLFGRTGGGSGSIIEADVVCRDGWAVNIVADSNYP